MAASWIPILAASAPHLEPPCFTMHLMPCCNNFIRYAATKGAISTNLLPQAVRCT